MAEQMYGDKQLEQQLTAHILINQQDSESTLEKA